MEYPSKNPLTWKYGSYAKRKCLFWELVLYISTADCIKRWTWHSGTQTNRVHFLKDLRMSVGVFRAGKRLNKQNKKQSCELHTHKQINNNNNPTTSPGIQLNVFTLYYVWKCWYKYSIILPAVQHVSVIIQESKDSIKGCFVVVFWLGMFIPYCVTCLYDRNMESSWNLVTHVQIFVFRSEDRGMTCMVVAALSACLTTHNHRYLPVAVTQAWHFSLFFGCSESDTAIFNTHGSTLDLTQKAQLIHAAATATQPHCIKTELPDNDPLLTAMTSTDTSTTLTRPATIILATTTSSTTQEFSNSPQAVFPTTTVQIKTEPMDAYETLQEQTGKAWGDCK